MIRLSIKPIALTYGTHSLTLATKFPHLYEILTPSFPKAIVNTEEYSNRVIDSPINTKPFNDFFSKNNKILIIL